MMCNLRKILFVQSQSAEAAPPLGTILGNVGVNTIKFCEEFNKKTIKLPSYFTVKVIININDNRTFDFFIENTSMAYFFNILKYKYMTKIRLNNQIIEQEITCLKLKDIIILTLYKFPNYTLLESFNIVLGIIRTMNIKIIK